jgi:inorganic pyrophosphatase
MCQTWQKSCSKPVEVLILSTFAVEAESLVDVRIIGGLERQFKSRFGTDSTDLKVICVQKFDPRTKEMTDIANLSPQALKHIRTIFEHSAEVSGGSACKINRTLSAAETIDAAQRCHHDYLESFTDKTIHNAPNLWCLPWLKESSQGDNSKRVFPAVVEAPKHCSNKYCFDPDSGVLKCLGPLKTATFYPANAGFIPQTVAEDGRPVDVMILSTIPLQSRCGVEIRIVGAAECIDEMGPDIKILGVPKSEPRMKEWDGIDAVPKHMKDEMVHFFNAYKDLDDDWKFCRFERWLDMDEAVQYVQSAHSRFFLFALPMQRMEKRVQELEAENSKLKADLGVGEMSAQSKLKAQFT